ncbi:MAG TPA: FAD-dependent oxidoreductase, partial [Dehalococcoidales bacterium]|nr:FAD-dependent oxidoreductase [Dehalococcoidales bacterium]
MSKNIAIYGSGRQAAQTALTLADLGIRVELITPYPVLDSERLNADGAYKCWPLLLRTAIHPHVKINTCSVITGISGKAGDYSITFRRNPRFVKEELCTACGDCSQACSVKIDSITAIHKPDTQGKSAPSAFIIDKDGVSPCRTACPLEINVHGFVALLRQGKREEALNLINSGAPLAGVLGRLCTHPCELKCSRQEVDQPLFIKALHRYAADQNSGRISYQLKSESKHLDKVAIIGSGPAGLTAAWELARRGYNPTIFESQKIAGGMLSSGIPGFRLPAEVYQKEIEAILKMGVEIKTG